MIRTRRLVPLGLALSTCLTTLAQAQQVPGPGDAAPPITLDALTNAPDGVQASWDAWGAGTTVIEFWGTWCGPCVAAVPHMNELHDEFAPKGVNFLSVTYEEPSITNRFQERMKLHTWIGHDMDQSMVKDYAVRAWPTTFVVRDGVIVARTHPNNLNAERLTALVENRQDRVDVRAATVQEPAQLGPDGRPVVAGNIRAGVDPYSMLTDEQPQFQVIVRKGGELSMLVFGGPGGTLLGISLHDVIYNLWDAPSYAIEISEDVPKDTYDVIYRVPSDLHMEMRPMVREIVAKALNLRTRTEPRTILAYEMRVAERGLNLEPGLEERSGMGASGTRESLTITSASAPVSAIVGNVSGMLGVPVIDKTDDDGLYFLNVTLPRDRGQLVKMLEDDIGLVLVPIDHEIEMTIVEPAS